MIKRLAALAVLGLVAGAAGQAEAGLITYTFRFQGTGSLGAKSFTDADITLSLTGDTADIETGTSPSTFFRFRFDSSTVDVAGVGSGTLREPVETVLLPSDGELRFVTVDERTGRAFLLALAVSPALGDYDLSTSFASTSVSVSFNPVLLGSAETSAGSFALSEIGPSGTFEAVAAVPEPSTLISGGIAGVVGLGLAWRRRRARTAVAA